MELPEEFASHVSEPSWKLTLYLQLGLCSRDQQLYRKLINDSKLN